MKKIILTLCFISSIFLNSFVLANDSTIVEPDGRKVHINNSQYTNASALFMNIGSDNWQEVLHQCKQGGFKILICTLFEPGDFHSPFRFDLRGQVDRQPFGSFDELKVAIDTIRSEGILVGVHGFWNVIHPDGSSTIGINYGNPPADWGDILYSIPVGKITKSINNWEQNIELDSTVKSNPMWKHYAELNASVPVWGKPWHLSYYAIGKEIMWCADSNITSNKLKVVRRSYRTSPVEHNVGETVYYLPHRSGFFINHDSSWQQQNISMFEDAVSKLGLQFFYCDGWSYPNLPTEDYGQSTEGMYQRGIAPYFENVSGLIQFGGAVPISAEKDVRWVASGDALWAYDPATGLFDIDRVLRIKTDIISRENVTKIYKFEAGWLPLCKELTAEDIIKVYSNPDLKNRRITWQEIPGWMTKPKPERDALLALIKILSA